MIAKIFIKMTVMGLALVGGTALAYQSYLSDLQLRVCLADQSRCYLIESDSSSQPIFGNIYVFRKMRLSEFSVAAKTVKAKRFIGAGDEGYYDPRYGTIVMRHAPLKIRGAVTRETVLDLNSGKISYY